MSYFNELVQAGEKSGEDDHDEDFLYESNSDSEANENSIKSKVVDKLKINTILNQMKLDFEDSIRKEKKKINAEDLLLLSRGLLKAKSSNFKKVMFAGICYEVNEDDELVPVNQSQNKIEIQFQEQKRKYSEKVEQVCNNIEKAQTIHKSKFAYVNKILEMLKNKARTITSISKSKLDWKSYVKENKIDKNLEANRKGGFLEKQKFMSSVDEKVKEKTRNLKKKVKLT